VFAIVTAVFAILAFRKQSKEVSDQAEVLKVQSRQLDLQSQQLNDQRKINELQVEDLRESLEERKREAEQRRSAQATKVFMSHKLEVCFRQEDDDEPESIQASVTVVNTSDRPIYNIVLHWLRDSVHYDGFLVEPLGTIMPGRETMRPRTFPPDTNMAVSLAVVTFRDAANVTWIRWPDGILTEHSPDQAVDAAKAAIKAPAIK
jgi:hypothetical protein